MRVWIVRLKTCTDPPCLLFTCVSSSASGIGPASHLSIAGVGFPGDERHGRYLSTGELFSY